MKRYKVEFEADGRNWAKDSDCADCGQSEASFLFDGEDRICEGCAPQYQPEDLTAV